MSATEPVGDASEEASRADDLSMAKTSQGAMDDLQLAPVDDLLAELMDSNSDTSVAVDMPPTISVVPTIRRGARQARGPRADMTAGVFVEVLNGPNAGQIAPMTRREFVLGKSGATKAVIRREEGRFVLVPVDLDAASTVNGEHVGPEGVQLAFGDTIDVAGVKLRFGRRPPL